MKKLLSVLKGEKLSPPPIWLMRQAGRYLPEYRKLRSEQKDLRTFFLSPDCASEATLQPLRRYDLDAAIVFSDILILPYAMGRNLVYHENTGPSLTPLTISDLVNLPENPSRSILETASETIALTLPHLPPDVAMIGFAGSPFTVACYMIDGGSVRNFPKCQHWISDHYQDFLTLIDILTEHTISLLQSQIDAGAEVVQIFDSWAGIVDDRYFDDIIIAPTRNIVDALKSSHPDTPVIGFPRLVGKRITNYTIKSGVNAISLDSTMDAALLRSSLPSAYRHIPMQGNIDPEILVQGGEALENACISLFNSVKNTPHIVNLGHGVLKNTPPDHVEKLIALLKS